MSYVPSAYQQRASVYSKSSRVQSVFDPHVSHVSFRPGVVPGHELMETEFEEDGSDLEEFSGRRSEDSMGKRSTTTLSSVDELQTPDTQSNEFLGFNFQLGDLAPAKSVEGPMGPHLFRMSTDSTRELEFYMSMSPPASPDEVRVAPHRPAPRVSRQPDTPIEPPPRTSVPLRTWSPRQVAEWMHGQGFDRTIVDTFFINDISGITLIDLQYEDLKELGITSFGQRHRLWTEIRALKEQKLDGFEHEFVFEESVPEGPPAEAYPEVQKPACPSPVSPDHDVVSPTSGRRRRRQAGGDDVISPAESASIVAIEQLLPKPHKCSKGENCAKWQKQQRKLARIATEFPLEMAQIAAQKDSPTESGVAASSVVVPSVVASSDLLGDARPSMRLEEDTLRTLAARDPQENVRQFLDFQHFNDVKPKQQPDSPVYEMFPPLAPPRAQPPPRAELRSLPRLTIPADPAAELASPNRTAKPRRRQTASPLHGFHISQSPVVHDLWRIGSPASEMDVPVTAIPLGPIERDASSSVPPDMRYGAAAALGRSLSRSSSRAGYRDGPVPAFHMPSGAMSPIRRTNSLATHRRHPSLPGALREETAAEAAAAEPDSPTEIEGDEGDVTPTTARPGDASHDGWMKKRRTRMLRHEWHEAHFRLRGSQLAMHPDASARAALETIDVDDYAVAVSAGPGAASKLNAAMRRLHLSKKQEQLDPHAFAFQLTPAAERRGVRHAATGKTHHFAVRTATERIDWMRELMLARARKEKGVDIASFE